MRFFLFVLLLIGPLAGSASAITIKSFSKVKDFKNGSLNKLHELAADDKTWAYQGFGRFGNFFDWKAQRYWGALARNEQLVALRVAYGKRGKSFEEYKKNDLKELSLVDLKIARQKVVEWLTAKYEPKGGLAQSQKALRTIAETVDGLDPALQVYLGREESEYKDLYLTIIIDTHNKEVFSISVGMMDLEEGLD